jgi:RNA polymerase sigma-70 factor (ECF subfamily)
MLHPFDRPDESALVASAQAGDCSALTRLLRQYDAQAYRIALRITNSHEDAQDVLQESHLNAYRHLSKFRGESRFATWLLKIVARQAVTALRRRFSRREISLESVLESEDERWTLRVDLDKRDGPELRAIKSELRSIVAGSMADLDDPYRVALELREFQSLSVTEMAVSLRISVPAVKARLFRARRRLHTRVLKRLQSRKLNRN